jgi:hypothetical protein
MDIAAIIAVVVVISAVLYVIRARHKARRKIVPAKKNQLRQHEVRPTIRYAALIGTQAADSVQPDREMPSVKVESKPDNAVEVARPMMRNPEPAAEPPAHSAGTTGYSGISPSVATLSPQRNIL